MRFPLLYIESETERRSNNFKLLQLFAHFWSTAHPMWFQTIGTSFFFISVETKYFFYTYLRFFFNLVWICSSNHGYLHSFTSAQVDITAGVSGSGWPTPRYSPPKIRNGVPEILIRNPHKCLEHFQDPLWYTYIYIYILHCTITMYRVSQK